MAKMISRRRAGISTLITQVEGFLRECRLDPATWAFASSVGGAETLYASCFAAMLYHFIGLLDNVTPDDKQNWAAYLNSWQEPETGYFYGPELVSGEMQSRKHSVEHVSQHLTAHVLPALALLGAQPRYQLSFAHPFTDLGQLQNWLDKRDWHDAWLEGNNLLFVGQFLIYLRDVEKHPQAESALDHLFSWLDAEVDPHTGLWGSNGYCSYAAALYGGYHQLLLYYYEGRPVNYPHRLVDVALSLQHADGGFNLRGGGGACEDTDAIDILVNMYKQIDYRRTEIRIALRKALAHILQHNMPDGGFVYRLDEPFIHMGIGKTASAANNSNLFPTWFRVHTLALISEVLTDQPLAAFNWKFNQDCSMGWHRAWKKEQNSLSWVDTLDENRHRAQRSFRKAAAGSHRLLKRSMNVARRKLLHS